MTLSRAAAPEWILTRPPAVTAFRGRHFAPRVKQTPLKCIPTGGLDLFSLRHRSIRRSVDIAIVFVAGSSSKENERSEAASLIAPWLSGADAGQRLRGLENRGRRAELHDRSREGRRDLSVLAC
jgi:hypothetical protein